MFIIFYRRRIFLLAGNIHIRPDEPSGAEQLCRYKSLEYKFCKLKKFIFGSKLLLFHLNFTRDTKLGNNFLNNFNSFAMRINYFRYLIWNLKGLQVAMWKQIDGDGIGISLMEYREQASRISSHWFDQKMLSRIDST